MLIGIIGAPNKGKSTLFSALTMANAEIGDYPFTTIKPNRGVAYVARECPEKQLGLKCNPRNSTCTNGIRYIPIEIVDVAGLVPGAHLGKGMGNQFLTDAIAADVLIQVIDGTGKTDLNGNHTQTSNPAEEVRMIFDELSHWVAGIVKKHMPAMIKRKDGTKALHEVLAGLRISEKIIEDTVNKLGLASSGINWKDEEILSFSQALVRAGKPIVVAINKSDSASPQQIEKINESLKEMEVVACSAAVELSLKKAAKAGIIDYASGARGFNITGNATDEQNKGLEFMKSFVQKSGTGIQELLHSAIFKTLNLIVVYPVEDENKCTDHFGNVLPDARLMRRGGTAVDLARMIHTDLEKNFLYAIDAKKKMRIGKEHQLNDGDVIKIASAAK
ncbi:MAG: YchF-related putative GTPase [Candidatus Micrarchaeota archaeon]|nr:YchF-related putative GTPase [Candidatus Micrarchaeota archaeon]